ncbi:Cytochrome P450 71B36, partial [Clarias magur]
MKLSESMFSILRLESQQPIRSDDHFSLIKPLTNPRQPGPAVSSVSLRVSCEI